MATDIQLMIDNLGAFYDFSGKTVIDVGGGGGQFIDFARPALKVIAIDSDPNALKMLEKAVASKAMTALFELRQGDFNTLALSADVVFFEFCLHEMPDPLASITHARSLAADVVVIDHAPDSEWAYYVHEEEKVRHSFAAMQQAKVRKQALFQAEQRFKNHAELVAKVSPQGAVAIARCERFKQTMDIVIPMIYSVTLL